MSQIVDLFPGFKVAPTDESREIKPRAGLRFIEPPQERDEEEVDDEFNPDACNFCEGWGYVDCHCGGDLCVCNYNGEIPCPTCM